MMEFWVERSKIMLIGLLTAVDGLFLFLSLGCFQSHFARVFMTFLARRKFERWQASQPENPTWPQAKPSEEALQRAKRVKKAL